MAQIASCPICKKTLKFEFLENDEDWAWKNVTRKDDKVQLPWLIGKVLYLNGLTDLSRNMLCRGSYFYEYPCGEATE